MWNFCHICLFQCITLCLKSSNYSLFIRVKKNIWWFLSTWINLFWFCLDIMTTDVFMFFSDYTYYETLGPQQPSVQWQISCIKNLVTHPSDVAPPAYDWNDVAVSTAKKKKKISICVFKKGGKCRKRSILFTLIVALSAAVLASGHPWCLLGSLAKWIASLLLNLATAEEQQRYAG